MLRTSKLKNKIAGAVFPVYDMSSQYGEVLRIHFKALFARLIKRAQMAFFEQTRA